MNKVLNLNTRHSRLVGMTDKDEDSNGLKKLKRMLETRRSNAAGPHRSAKEYRRKPKYPNEKYN